MTIRTPTVSLLSARSTINARSPLIAFTAPPHVPCVTQIPSTHLCPRGAQTQLKELYSELGEEASSSEMEFVAYRIMYYLYLQARVAARSCRWPPLSERLRASSSRAGEQKI